ncbi:nitrite/sulfite reductase [Micrococcus luteus]|uniref:assimilatory sulfite reductase (ferredoxin) n=3 Tax=Micrococcus TaxID=1269 RepID=A0ABR6DWA1_9MICC|nr:MULTISPECIES: nitrite/sulfite reductase [Micrococcus]OOL28800.1 sulfite reductase [Rhodococcus rhodochrous]EZP43931.1 Nitrite/sulfite reductase ferredoxin domain protein [Micrococcus luteus]EZP51908.1 Nitrite/sulfite reductase ferredoxin domain protein [Micrococcus luteus]KZE63682.1 sulfite reductase [Micrococcus aloeverae]MBA9080593.1 sulfite reductase (ferredoxin) [Micrococcus aloeverae]
MTQVNETSRPARTPRRPSAKPHGQWKVDGTAPLNHNEEFKQQDDGLNVRERIEQVYAHEGFDSIPSDDLHGRFRWWGLYTQRRQGIDGGKTATLEPHELEDRYFMLRVRIDGGDLTTEQLRVIGGISTDFGRDTADITDRQNVQLHWIRVEDVPEIWRRLESVGLSTTEACGDVPRVILGSPVAGIAADEIIDPTPVIREIADRWIGDLEISNLPRKFKTAITGHPSQDVVHEINDVSLIGVVHPELGPGYDLWVGGGLSTKARLADRIGAFVSAERAPEVWHAVVSIFRDYGYRRLRNKARMKYLLEDWGPERFRTVLEEEYLGYALPDGPAPAPPTRPGDHVGVHEQKDGRFYIGAAPVVGRSSGTTLTALADLLEAHGSTRLRTTPHQKIVVLDVERDRVDAVVAGLKELGLDPEPSVFRRSTIACTGLEFCKLAIVDTKDTATAAIAQLEERLADLADRLPERLSLHVNGCPNSCARIQTADIGLKGQLLPDDDGGQTPGFQVHLGGGLASVDRAEAGLGRSVRGLKVRADGLVDYVERVVRRYDEQREPGETFARWAHRVDEEALR